jgi:hypothetical protein
MPPSRLAACLCGATDAFEMQSGPVDQLDEFAHAIFNGEPLARSGAAFQQVGAPHRPLVALVVSVVFAGWPTDRKRNPSRARRGQGAAAGLSTRRTPPTSASRLALPAPFNRSLRRPVVVGAACRRCRRHLLADCLPLNPGDSRCGRS